MTQHQIIIFPERIFWKSHIILIVSPNTFWPFLNSERLRVSTHKDRMIIQLSNLYHRKWNKSSAICLTMRVIEARYLLWRIFLKTRIGFWITPIHFRLVESYSLFVMLLKLCILIRTLSRAPSTKLLSILSDNCLKWKIL